MRNPYDLGYRNYILDTMLKAQSMKNITKDTLFKLNIFALQNSVKMRI